MAANLLRIDSSRETHMPVCACGWRGPVVPSRPAAQAAADAHRAARHSVAAAQAKWARQKGSRR